MSAPIVERDAHATLPLSARLHEGTREVHERVEHTASFNRLVVVRLPAPEPAAPRAEHERFARAREEYREIYRRFLVASHGFECAVTERLAGSRAHAAAVASGWAPEARDPAALVRDDLACVFGPAAAAELPRMDGLPEADSLATFAGIEYVRRGSRAGGAVIAAVVEKNLGLTREGGGSFLMQYGRETRAVLVAMRAWLDGLPLSERECRDAIAAAGDTFAAAERWHARLDAAFARGA